MRFWLFQTPGEHLSVESDQNIAFFYKIGVIGPDFRHAARHLRHNLNLIPCHVCVIGFFEMTQYQKPINPYRYGNNYKEQGGEGGRRLRLPLFFTGCCGFEFRICAHIVLHNLLNSSAEPTCLPKRPHLAMLASHFFFYKSGFLSEMTR
ncbi:hypothetical protein ACVXHA_27845 [Escherichia coli]